MSCTAAVRIADFCKTGSGGTPSRSQMERYYEGGTIPWIKSGELRESVINHAAEYVTQAALKESSIKLVPAGAILLAMYGATVGRLGILGIEATTNQAICHIVPDPKLANTRYVFHAISNRVPKLIAMGVGGAQPNISQAIIKDLAIPLPPLTEQIRIAAILDQADALRVRRREALAQLDNLTQAIFIEMFGDPADNPKGFTKKKLGELIKFEGGSQPPASVFSSEPSPENIRLIQIRDFKSDRFKTFIPRRLARRFLEEDDVMIGRYGPPVFQILKGLSGSYNVALIKAVPRENLTKKFVYYLLQEQKLHNFVVANSERTAGQSGVNLELLEKYMAYLPPLQLQQDFSKRVDMVDRLKEASQKSLTELDSLFASLQHRAFRGEL